MAMKPWFKVVTPREDLRDGRPLDAAEFAVHLDKVRRGDAPAVYLNPVEFFERTYFTKTLRDLAVQVVRRLSGIKVETSAVFNLATQFGGGKTHALTMLYHLASGGDAAGSWMGVKSVLDDAGLARAPKATPFIFVGTEFDSLVGRGGDDGEPLRKTPWGELAFQLGNAEGRAAEALRLVQEHERTLTAPGGDVLERLLPKDKPTLLLFDELMNYVSRNRRSGLAAQLYNFLHNLSEVTRGRDNAVLAVSIPASELEMTAEDQEDFDRYKKLLDRLGKAMVMSAEAETSEIIRRRLFEWGGVPREASATLDEYESWFVANRQQVPSWFPVDGARELLKTTYPFHPSVLSVFERKWRALPRFQQTRGVLRLLALWVSRAYADGYKGAHKDPLISLGTAPLDDTNFRSAMFEQLGEQRLEAAVTTDLCGNERAHALRLDAEADVEVKKTRLHRKVATAVFFESNGGQSRGEATQPEIRLAVAEPGVELGSVEQCLEALADNCYFLTSERNRYRFSFQPNLNKLLADRRATVNAAALQERVREEIRKVFSTGAGPERVYFPEKSGQIPDRAVLTLVVMPPEAAAGDAATQKQILALTQENGASARTFKSALLWAAAESGAGLLDEARKLLAWQDIEGDDSLRLDEGGRRQVEEKVKASQKDLREAVWRTYKNVFLLGDDNALRRIDLGLIHSSASTSLVQLMVSRLRQDDLIVDGVSPNFLARYWPPAVPEWSTKAVRDMFFASPKFPRLLKPEAVKDTIAKGVEAGTLAIVGKLADGSYSPLIFRKSLTSADVELTDDVFIIGKDLADAYLARRTAPPTTPPGPGVPPVTTRGLPAVIPPTEAPPVSPPAGTLKGFTWGGEVPSQKWTTFYTKVLSRFATGGGLKLTVSVEVAPPGGTTAARAEETRVALRELGLSEALAPLPDDGG